ncbi:LuxR family transcriptional regulator [Microbacterium resistens]|uniref:helix-turn-helix transcriptional regulator n=1 Tax=Microbacterium resistens TaxID=156977 RepID=UPI001C58A4C5|nr:LuxR family transcriptional regulator [Microbacterium resistens]MBW1638655.1 LuxR family transcriptional regulator [Microbacterium resistens]
MTITDPSDAPSYRPDPVSPALLASLPDGVDAGVHSALARGDVGEALRRAVDTGDLDLAVDVLRIGWFDLLRDENRSRNRRKLETLSSAQLMNHPLLAMALGLLFNGDGLRRSKAAYYFGLAATGVRAHPERTSPVQRALVLASESAALRLLGRTSVSAASARAALRALDAIHEERKSLIGYLPRVYSQLGTSLFYGGHATEALHAFARGYAEAGTEDRSSFGNVAMAAGVHALQGNLTDARELVTIARGEPWTDEQRRMYVGTFYRIAEAVLALEQFDTTAARAHLDAMVHDRRSIEHWAVIVQVESLVSIVDGDPAAGLAFLEEYAALRGPESETRSNRHRLASSRSLLHIALGNYDAAEWVLRVDAGKRPQDHVDRARLMLATNRVGEALREVRTTAGRSQSIRTALEALTIEAAVGLRTGMDRRTETVLRQVAATMRRTGQRLAPRLLPPADARAVIEALRTTGAADLASECGPSLLAEPDLPELTDRELAVLEALSRTSATSDIAAELFVSVNTVKTHRKSVYRKLGARTREEALAVAFHRHLISTHRR